MTEIVDLAKPAVVEGLKVRQYQAEGQRRGAHSGKASRSCAKLHGHDPHRPRPAGCPSVGPRCLAACDLGLQRTGGLKVYPAGVLLLYHRRVQLCVLKQSELGEPARGSGEGLFGQRVLAPRLHVPTVRSRNIGGLREGRECSEVRSREKSAQSTVVADELEAVADDSEDVGYGRYQQAGRWRGWRHPRADPHAPRRVPVTLGDRDAELVELGGESRELVVRREASGDAREGVRKRRRARCDLLEQRKLTGGQDPVRVTRNREHDPNLLGDYEPRCLVHPFPLVRDSDRLSSG